MFKTIKNKINQMVQNKIDKWTIKIADGLANELANANNDDPKKLKKRLLEIEGEKNEKNKI